MAYTPEQIQKAMKKSKAAGDSAATADLRKMLVTAYETEASGMSAASESGVENFMAGLASGVVDVGRKATNLATEIPGLGGLRPDWASDEAIAEQGRLDTDLMDTGAGMMGNLAGSIAATAPLGMGAGGLALKAGSRLLPKALSAAGKGAKVGRGMVQGAAQGASEGAILSSPDNRGVGAGFGGVLGAGMPLVARTAGALMRKLGRPAAKTTEASEELLTKMRESGIEDPFIPLSQSAESGVIKQLYQGIIANIPGSGLRGQRTKALDDFRQAVFHEVVPDGTEASIIFQVGDDAADGFRRLDRAWDETWDVVNNAEIMIPQGIVPDAILKQAKKATKGQFTVPQPGRGTGQDLTKLSKKFQELADMQEGMIGADDAMMYIGMKNQVDDLLAKSLPEAEAAIWRANKNKFSTYNDLLAGTKGKMGSGEFTPKALAQATAQRSGKVGGKEGQVMQEFGALGEKALEDFPSKLGVFQSLAATGAAGGILGGGAALVFNDHPKLAATLGFLSAFGGARLAANPAVQKALTRGWGLARRQGVRQDEYKKVLEGLGFTARQIAVHEATEKE